MTDEGEREVFSVQCSDGEESLGTGKENSGRRSEVRSHAVARTASQIRSFASSQPSALSMTGMSVVSVLAGPMCQG
jgi:1,2-phenylacetyl-CoA epoxidase PaaB subunit